jgi:hypothetical protein
MLAWENAERIFRNQRRDAISKHCSQIGIDYIEVRKAPAQQWILELHFIPFSPQDPFDCKRKDVIPVPLPTASQIEIRGIAPLINTGIDVVAIAQSSDTTLAITIRYNDDIAIIKDLPTYILTLNNIPQLDPFFNQVIFSLVADVPSNFNVYQAQPAAPPPPPGPAIDYLARDYRSFRQVMLDRLSLLIPQWSNDSPADTAEMLVEIMAYVADQLSYYQDAVATEAYLGTARQRISVRRHTRLLDYTLSEGCNSRVWVALHTTSASRALPKGTQLLASGGAVVVPFMSELYQQLLSQGAKIFETMEQATLCRAHNTIAIYTWNAGDYYLAQGATEATLVDVISDGVRQLQLNVGDVLIFEEVRGLPGARAGESNPAHRHAVRLTGVDATLRDPLGDQFRSPFYSPAVNGVPLVKVTWSPEDALPFPLFVSKSAAGQFWDGLVVVRGNVVLADHGHQIVGEALSPMIVPGHGPYRPRVQQRDLTYRVPYDPVVGRRLSALATVRQRPSDALPAIDLREQDALDDRAWTARSDLLSSGPEARHFVVEVANDRSAYLRFGDNILGQRPMAGAVLRATYRIGNGTAGNIGWDTIRQIVSTPADPLLDIVVVRNPLPSYTGTDPESLGQARLSAPQMYHTQERCVTEADYTAIAERYLDVKQARATQRWTGSWPTMFIAVNRKGNLPVDETFQANLQAFMQPYLLTGTDLAILPPSFVPLEISLRVSVAAGHFLTTVRENLLKAFSNIILPDGQRGFFYPDNFTFGQPVYASQVIACASNVSGVVRVDLLKFQRLRQPPHGEIDRGFIPIGPLEIARLDNSPSAPEYGQITLEIKDVDEANA